MKEKVWVLAKVVEYYQPFLWKDLFYLNSIHSPNFLNFRISNTVVLTSYLRIFSSSLVKSPLTIIERPDFSYNVKVVN